MSEPPIVRPLRLDDITAVIVDAALRLHRDVGPRLLESLYVKLLAGVLESRGLDVLREVPVDIEYRGMHFERAVRIDLLVEGAVVVELKSTPAAHPAHAKQVLTYLRLTGLHVGLLLNFGAPRMIDGLQRLVNDAPGQHPLTLPDRP